MKFALYFDLISEFLVSLDQMSGPPSYAGIHSSRRLPVNK